MITLPDGFDATQLFADLFALAAPFVTIAFIVACGFLIVNTFRSVRF